MGRVFLAILMIFLLLGPFRTPILEGIEGWRTQDISDSFVVVTAAGQTTANVTLTEDLFQDATAQVDSITSTKTESPVATTYTAASNKLLVSALNASDNRTLTVTYDADTDDTVTKAVGPFLNFLIFGVALVMILFAAGLKLPGGRRH